MARLAVEFTRPAEKAFGRLPDSVRRRFGESIELLAQEPIRARPGVDIKRLRGLDSTWRPRVGDYRGIFEVEPGRLVFTRFGHGSKVYDT